MLFYTKRLKLQCHKQGRTHKLVQPRAETVSTLLSIGGLGCYGLLGFFFLTEIIQNLYVLRVTPRGG